MRKISMMLTSVFFALTMGVVSAIYVPVPDDFKIIQNTTNKISAMPVELLSIVDQRIDNILSFTTDERMKFIMNHVSYAVKSMKSQGNKPFSVNGPSSPMMNQPTSLADIYPGAVQIDNQAQLMRVNVCVKNAPFAGVVETKVVANKVTRVYKGTLVSNTSKNKCIAHDIPFESFAMKATNKYDVAVSVDVFNTIGESSESNNSKTRTIIVEKFDLKQLYGKPLIEVKAIDMYVSSAQYNTINNTIDIKLCNSYGNYTGPLMLAIIIDQQLSQREIFVEDLSACLNYVIKAAEFTITKTDKAAITIILDPRKFIDDANTDNNVFKGSLILPPNYSNLALTHGVGNTDLLLKDISLINPLNCINCAKVIIKVCNQGEKAVDMNQVTTSVKIGNGVWYPMSHQDTILWQDECDEVDMNLSKILQSGSYNSYTVHAKTDFFQIINEENEVNNSNARSFTSR